MWYNIGVDDPFIFFLIGPKRAINNHNDNRIFKGPWTCRSPDSWRINDFGSSNVIQLAPELITYWKDE